MHSKFQSQLNPDFQGKSYQCLLIHYIDDRSDYAVYGEKMTQLRIFQNFGPSIHCYLYSQEFDTVNNTPVEVFKNVLAFEKAKNIDGVLVCTSERGLKKQSQLYFTKQGNQMWRNDDKKFSNYTMELQDANNQGSIWTGRAFTEAGDVQFSFTDMTDHFIDDCLKDLKIKNLITAGNPAPAASPMAQPQRP